jgi:hypothetical protein
MMVAPRRKVTVPAFTVDVLVTVAVSRNVWDVVDGFGVLVRVVVVAASPLVVSVTLQLPIVPAAPALPVSSMGYKLQVPFGAAPPKIDANVAEP